jgi:hypothetical protein
MVIQGLERVVKPRAVELLGTATDDSSVVARVAHGDVSDVITSQGENVHDGLVPPALVH